MEKFEEEKKVKMYADEEHEAKRDVNGKKKQVGGVRTMPFILGVFCFEILFICFL